ncbi:MAG: hypothetical protein KTR31_31840 [Myxococcales bacterium]|nr:hypothetical protein [Myxococcales bacterium]
MTVHVDIVPKEGLFLAVADAAGEFAYAQTLPHDEVMEMRLDDVPEGGHGCAPGSVLDPGARLVISSLGGVLPRHCRPCVVRVVGSGGDAGHLVEVERDAMNPQADPSSIFSP